MSTDERPPALTHERVLAALAEMFDEETEAGDFHRKRLGSLERYDNVHSGRLALHHERATALLTAIDAMDRQHEDSALLDLMERCRIEPFWNRKRQAWDLTGLRHFSREQERALTDLLDAYPSGWVHLRDMLRSAATALEGKDGGERG